MKKSFATLSVILFSCMGLAIQSCSISRNCDVLIVGGGTGGVSAGIQAGRMGMKTIIAEETPWLGGMLTSAGVSATDGNYNLRGGLFGEFTDSIANYYGGYDKIKTGWVSSILFEPHIGDRIFKNIAAKTENLSVLYDTKFTSCKKSDNGWEVELVSKLGKQKIHARVLIDGTELGDVAKMCGVPYKVGMDAKSDTGEGIAAEKASDIVQDLTMVAILKDYGPNADMTIEKPQNYRPELYYNSAIGPNNQDVSTDPKTGFVTKNSTGQRVWSKGMMLSYGKLPVLPAKDGSYTGAKYMLNWPGDGNDFYANMIDMTPEQRKAVVDSAKNITLGFLYYMQTEYGFKNLGLADDEYPTADRFPFYPYHRESRRIDGEVRFKIEDVSKPFERPDALYRTAIAVGSYPVDHHHLRNPKWDKSMDLHFYPIPSFSLPLGVMIPKNFDNLITAEKSISVSNIINGTTRLQPVVMQIGQAAGVLASLAIRNNDGNLRSVKVRDIQKALLDAGGYIMPYLDLKPDDKDFILLQKIGATGIMRGEGKSVNWSNETWFRINDPVQKNEIFLDDYYPGKTFEELGLPAIDGKITRLEYARMIEKILHPFESFDVDLHGQVIK